jgi:hypothetical protein
VQRTCPRPFSGQMVVSPKLHPICSGWEGLRELKAPKGNRRRFCYFEPILHTCYAKLNLMSARVVSGLAPAGKPHPTTKWSLLIALLVVVSLGVPKWAAAGSPTVQPPTGPNATYSGGVYYFSGAYSFATYIMCTDGLNFNSSYSNGMIGTHSFDFYGAPDGSLLVSIDGGGLLLVSSCGDPYATPANDVANYTVSISTPPPPPTPSPTPSSTPSPTPTPTPTPPHGGGGGGSSGGGSGSSHASTGITGSNSSNTQTPVASSAPSTAQTVVQTPVATVTPTSSKPSTPVQKVIGRITTVPKASMPMWAVASSLIILALGLLLILLFVRSKRLRNWVDDHLRWFSLRIEPYWFRLKTGVRHWLRVHGRELLRRRGLSEHRHSGKMLAHHHTSYPALAFLLLVSAVFATSQTIATLADSSASSTLSLTVLGPPPSTPAVITQPNPGQHFTTPTQTVLGTCPGDVFVEIWRNGVFAGSAICDSNDLFSVLTTLTPGQNDLVARVVDALGQYGPDSATVTVYYDQPQPTPSPSLSPSPSSTPAPTKTPTPSSTPRPHSGATSSPSPTPSTSGPSPVIVSSGQHFYQGFTPQVSLGWTVTVSGGETPYNVTWEWGDGSTSQIFLPASGQVSASHEYQKAGDYSVIIRAKDRLGTEGVLQVVAVVNGAAISGAASANSENDGNLLFIWPLLILASLTVLSFWLGERHEWSILKPRILNASLRTG